MDRSDPTSPQALRLLSFDRAWVEAHGRPPDSASERRAFAEALDRWKKEGASEDAPSH